jgi:peptidoglycan/LPS O-acetylase OafA/YrhL
MPANLTLSNGHAKPREKPAGRFYCPELDVLRFGAFLMVFVTHTLYGRAEMYAQYGVPALAAGILAGLVRAGAYGVDVFFTLSSYLITTLLLREYRQFGSIDVRAFYVRRILRIWPLYFLFLLVAIPLVDTALPGNHLSAGYLAAFLLLCGNWACALHGYQSNAAMPLWSVSIEEQFYLAWPWVMSRWIRRTGAIAWGMLIAASATRLALVIYRQYHPAAVAHPEIWCNTLARLDPIAAGALLALWLDRREWDLPVRWRVPLGSGGLALLGGAGLWGALDGWRALYSYPLVALGAGLVLLSVLGLHLRDGAMLRALAHLGKISYGLYVFHQACLGLCWKDHPSPGRAVAAKLAGFLLTVAVAMVSYRYFESPFLRLKESFARVLSRPA